MEHGKSLRPLARHGAAHIDLCDCGMIYFGVGPVTVKLTKEAFEQIARGVLAAQHALVGPQEASSEANGNIVRFTPRPLPL